MARFPESFGGTSSEKDTDTTSDPKKKKKLGQFVAVGTSGDKPGTDEKVEKTVPAKRFGEAFADSFIKKDDKEKLADSVDDDQEKSVADEKPEAPEQQDKSELTAAEAEADDTDENAEDYTEMLEQELRPNQFGTEVVVNLQGDEPVAERVIRLRGETNTDEQEQAENPYTVFTPQEQHQHRARDEQELPASQPAESEPAGPEPLNFAEARPPTPEAGAGGEVPPTDPPEATQPLPEQPELDPEPLRRTEDEVRRQHQESSGSRGVTSTGAGEWPATKQEVDDALYRNSKRNQQRGLLSGLLFGAWFTNRGMRRRQKQESKQLEQQAKQIKQLKTEARSNTYAQQSRETNTAQRFTNLERTVLETPEKTLEKLERNKTAQRIEANQPDVQEQLNIPADHRLETSAWHSIEVDSKTGKPVENPAFQYGHEYYRERAQENAPVDQRNVATGGVVLTAAALSQSDSRQQASGRGLPGQVGQVPNASGQGAPQPAIQQRGSSAKESSQAGPIWPWIVALVAVVFCLVLALH